MAFREGFPASTPLDFATGSLRDGSGFDEDYRVHLKLMHLGNGLAYRTDHGVKIQVLTRIDLLHHDQPLFSFKVHGESSYAAWPQCLMAFLHRCFDILRVMVTAANDDQVFEPTRDEQLAVTQISE